MKTKPTSKLWLVPVFSALLALPRIVWTDSHGHAAEPDHGSEHIVRLSSDQIIQNGIRITTAGPGTLANLLELPGQIVMNTDRVAHVVPRVAGVVQEVRKSLGDRVRAGEVLAVTDSRELAEARAVYLSARERAALADTTFRRKETLWKEKITAEQLYLEAKQARALAQVEEHTAEQKLLAMGISRNDLRSLAGHSLESLHPNEALGRFEITAPFAGTILERHVTLGEAVEANAPVFVLGDLNTVWVDLNVYPKDLASVQVGATVIVRAGETGPQGQGKIIHVQPLVNEETRHTFARVELDNRAAAWQPGLFVTGKITVSGTEVPVRVARGALQNVENQSVVFVQDDDGFEPRHVTLGRGDDHHVEVVSGLRPGDRYVESGSFIIKAELQKGEAEHEH